MKIRLYILITWILLGSCHPSNKELVLQKKEGAEVEIIDYIGNRYHGNFINVIKGNKDVKVHYNIEVNDSGRVLHVNKYDNKYFEQRTKGLDMYRSLQLLVSDTSKNDPNFFDHAVNGYYTDTFIVNNVIFSKNPKTNLEPLSVDEQKLFNRIDSLARANNIKYLGFDTGKVLGWFKYIF